MKILVLFTHPRSIPNSLFFYESQKRCHSQTLEGKQERCRIPRVSYLFYFLSVLSKKKLSLYCLVSWICLHQCNCPWAPRSTQAARTPFHQGDLKYPYLHCLAQTLSFVHILLVFGSTNGSFITVIVSNKSSGQLRQSVLTLWDKAVLFWVQN